MAELAPVAAPQAFPRLRLALQALNTRTYIALGLAFLVVSLLLVAAFAGLVPDRSAAIREGRAALAESDRKSTRLNSSHRL